MRLPGHRNLWVLGLLFACTGPTDDSSIDAALVVPRITLDKGLAVDSIGRVEALVSGTEMDTVRADMLLSPDKRSFSGQISFPPGDGRVLAINVYDLHGT